MRDSFTSNVGTRGVITNAGKSIHISCCFVVLTLATLLNSAWAGVCNGDHICNGKETAQNCPSDCTDGGSGGDTGNTAPDPYNLVRASFATKPELYPQAVYPDLYPNGQAQLEGKGGVFADGVDYCGPFDYWDWQDTSISYQTGGCETHNNSSNVSGGGRWFLISGPAGSEEVLNVIERWLVVDFSDPSGPDPLNPDNPEALSPCYNLDAGSIPELGIPLYLDDVPVDSEANTADQIVKDYDECVDNLAIRLSADRILKPKANQQQLDFSIRWRPDPSASIYWPPWGYVSYINPLYLRDPDPLNGDPQEWADIRCRVMSTRPARNKAHDRHEVELLRELSPSQTQLLGTYFLPLEVCVIRASD